MSRRLAQVKRCAVCARQFRPFKADQRTCDRSCMGILNARLHPRHYQMQAANAARKAKFEAGLAESLAGLSLVDAYKRGYSRGYRTAHHKVSRRVA